MEDHGEPPDEVAGQLGVHVSSVRKWAKAYRDGGAAALAAHPPTGARPKLTAAQEQTVLAWFHKPATEFGFATELWTAPRVARLIRERFDVSFHPRYLNAWLARRHITPQKPRRVPRERDEPRIARWLAEDWPRLKKTRRPSRPTSR